MAALYSRNKPSVNKIKNKEKSVNIVSTFELVLNYANQRKNNWPVKCFADKYLSQNVTLQEILQHYQTTLKGNNQIQPPSKAINKMKEKSKALNDTRQKEIGSSRIRPLSDTDYTSYTSIREGYLDLIHILDLKNRDSTIGKLVKHIIELDISVFHINIMFPRIVKASDSTSYNIIRSAIPDFKIGHFTQTENDIIIQAFRDLCDLCDIKNPVELVKLIQLVKTSDSLDIKRQNNVIGCFLSRKLRSTVRHCSDVLDWAIKILSDYNGGKFSKEEHKIIAEEVKKHGDSIEIWKSLAEKLNRDPEYYFNIRQAYKLNLSASDRKIGKWKINEDEILLNHLFKNKEFGIDSINSFKPLHFKNLIELKRDYRNIMEHYEGIVKPILLAYHQGILYTSYKYDFLSYVVENNIRSVKEIQWSRVLKDFPSQTKSSLGKILANFHKEKFYEKVPLYEKVRENLSKYRSHQFSRKEKEYRTAIVTIYANLKRNGISS